MRNSLWAPLLLPFLAGILHGDTNYSVTVIPTPGATMAVGYAINGSGQIAGMVRQGAATMPFVGDGAGITAIPLPTGWSSAMAYGLNDDGKISGYGVYGGNYRAFLGDANGFTAISLPVGWTSSFAIGINDSGQVAGYGSASTTGFIGNSAGIIPILDAEWSNVHGFDINAAGQVTGYGTNGGVLRAFLGEATGLEAIPLPSGWSSRGTGVNDSGLVAGYLISAADNHMQPFVGDPTGITLIPYIPGWTSMYTMTPSINSEGQVVGLGTGGWIWDSANGSRSLDTLVPAGWQILGAYGINDDGQIVARASNGDLGLSGAVVRLDPVAEPVPEPSSFVLLASFVTAGWLCRYGFRGRA